MISALRISRSRSSTTAAKTGPTQETRVDLPTIGPATLRGAAAAGLAGIVGEAERVLVLDRGELVRMADDLGLFVYGAPGGGEGA